MEVVGKKTVDRITNDVDEARVWYAVGRDNVGLATESASLDGLRERILSVLPELLDVPNAAGLDLELVVHGISTAQKPIAAE